MGNASIRRSLIQITLARSGSSPASRYAVADGSSLPASTMTWSQCAFTDCMTMRMVPSVLRVRCVPMTWNTPAVARAMRMARMAITTRSSMSVKPLRVFMAHPLVGNPQRRIVEIGQVVAPGLGDRLGGLRRPAGGGAHRARTEHAVPTGADNLKLPRAQVLAL